MVTHRVSILSLLLTIGFTGTLAGSVPADQFGVSPIFHPLVQAEDKHFLKVAWNRAKNEQKHRKNVEGLITQVMSGFRTGLKSQEMDQIPQLIVQSSQKYGYDPLFLTAVIVAESSFYNWAKSDHGALGLMQIRPGTGIFLASETNLAWKGKPTLFDPETNIALGTYYLDKLLRRFGDLSLALEAYNLGPSELARHLRDGRHPQTYSQRVFRVYSQIRSQAI